MKNVNWKKLLIVAADIVLAGYLVVAFAAFDKQKAGREVCSKVSIEIADGATNGFIDTKEVRRRLEAEHIYPLGRPMRYVDARKIENTLKATSFVKTAECYKTNSGEVCISVTQLLPVIRIKADNGDDYYVDDKNCVMPNSHYTSDLIIATGNISKAFATNSLSPLGKAIMANELWKNLVEQINVTPERGIEIVPRVGNHIVYLGTLPDRRRGVGRDSQVAEFVDLKLTRLMKFYKYGLPVAGWNKYSYINLEFDNQIICKRRPEYLHKQDDAAVPAKQEGSSSTAGKPDQAADDETIEAPEQSGEKPAASGRTKTKAEPSERKAATPSAKKRSEKRETAVRAAKPSKSGGRKAASGGKNNKNKSNKASGHKQ